MTRLLVHVEGLTEEQFVKELLAPHLRDHGYSQVSPRLIGNARQRHRRGGIKPWSAARNGIVNQLKEDPETFASTMVDYYGLPQSGSKAWPGRQQASVVTSPAKPRVIETALLEEVVQTMGRGFNPNRFIPFVMMHEFEALLFSDCKLFATAIDRPELETSFQGIRDAFSSPEEIDDDPDTAPSKRIRALAPNYEKPLMGILAALEIGLASMRAQCPHFDDWIARLETAAP